MSELDPVDAQIDEFQEQQMDERRMRAKALADLLAQRAVLRAHLRDLAIHHIGHRDASFVQMAVDESINKLVDCAIALGQCP